MPNPFKLVDVSKFDDAELGHIMKEAMLNKNMPLYTACLAQLNKRRDDARRKNDSK